MPNSYHSFSLFHQWQTTHIDQGCTPPTASSLQVSTATAAEAAKRELKTELEKLQLKKETAATIAEA